MKKEKEQPPVELEVQMPGFLDYLKATWPTATLLIVFIILATFAQNKDVSQMLPENPAKDVCPFEHGYWYCGEGFCIKVNQTEVKHYGII